jgi:hypothetical protein
MSERYLVLTCMKNEGPFILEWVAYHLSIGFDHFLVFTNDCDDPTVPILTRLQELGHVTHVDNTHRPGQRPSHQVRAFRKAPRQQAYQEADWVAVIDTDEFINIHVGDRSIRALTAAAPQSKCISLTWRLFGIGDRTEYRDVFLTEDLRHAAPLHCPKPAQAWGMKSIHRTDAVTVTGAHRPKIVPGDDWKALGWVNGSGEEMPEAYYAQGWRMKRGTIGYELGQLNHYALRNRETYLMKSVRGRAGTRVNTDGTMGATYWHQMNRNEELDETIQPLLPAARAIHAQLMEDPKLSRLHRRAVRWHTNSIAKLRDTEMSRELLAATQAPAP